MKYIEGAGLQVFLWLKIMVDFVFKIKTISYFKKKCTAVEKAVTIFQRKRRLGRGVRIHANTCILVSLRLIIKRSRYVYITKLE